MNDEPVFWSIFNRFIINPGFDAKSADFLFEE